MQREHREYKRDKARRCSRLVRPLGGRRRDMLQPIAHPSGPSSSASSPLPYPYRVIGMVMIAFVGVATFDKPGTGATSIHQAVIFSKPEAPVEERHTGSLLLLLRFLRS